MAFLRYLHRLLTLAVLLTPFLTFAQVDSVALSNEYYTQGMEVFGFTHRKQAAELLSWLHR